MGIRLRDDAHGRRSVQAGMVCFSSSIRGGAAVIGGRIVRPDQISGILTLRPGVFAPELRAIHPDDRAYVAAELNAFLLEWLMAQSCPVLNRPSFSCLAGPNWRMEQWIHVAARLGVPVRTCRRHACNDCSPRAEEHAVEIISVGEHCFGCDDPRLQSWNRRLAEAAGTDLLCTRFSLAEGDLLSATLGRGLPTRPCWQPFANGWGEKDDSRLGRAQRSAGGRRTSGLGASQSAGLLSQPTRRPGYRDGSVSGWDGRRCVAIENGRSGIGRRHRGLLEALRLGAAAGPCKAAPPNAVAHAAALDDAILCWSELASARVVNRPSAMASNQSKPHQLALIHAQGFRVPETLVTTDAAKVEAFWERHGEIIYKSMSGVRSIVSRLTPEHRARFGDLAHSPVQFQQWIRGHDVAFMWRARRCSHVTSAHPPSIIAIHGVRRKPRGSRRVACPENLPAVAVG